MAPQPPTPGRIVRTRSRIVRTRTRPPAEVSNVVQFRPRSRVEHVEQPEPSSEQPRPRGSRLDRLKDTAHRCGLTVDVVDGVVTSVLNPRNKSNRPLFDVPTCLDGLDGLLLLEMFLRLYERSLLDDAEGWGERR